MRPPTLDEPLAPRRVDGETVWVSRDGAWAVVPRRWVERVTGRRLDRPEASVPSVRPRDEVVRIERPVAPGTRVVLAVSAVVLGVSLAVIGASLAVLVLGPTVPPVAEAAPLPAVEVVVVTDDTGLEDEGTTFAPAWRALVDAGWSVLAKDPGLAASLFRGALARAPTQAEAHLGLGEALLAMGHTPDGAAEVCEARRLDRTLAARADDTLRRHRAACR